MLIQMKKKKEKKSNYAENIKAEKILKRADYNVMLNPGSNVQKYFKVKLFTFLCLILNIKKV